MSACFNSKVKDFNVPTRARSNVSDVELNEKSQLVTWAPHSDKSLKHGRRLASYPLRWFVLLLYSSAAFMQVVVWNTWGPVAPSALHAFPSWSTRTVAMLSDWGSLVFIVFICPFCWFMNKYGLRKSILLATVLLLLGAAVRCFGTNKETLFTVLAHIGAILNGMSGVILGPAIVILSATWFPQHQRTSATGVGTALNQLGLAGSYLIGPAVVSTPSNTSNITTGVLRRQISKLMIIDVVSIACIAVLVLLYFPDKPPHPPSMTRIMERLDFKQGVRTLLRSWNMWLLSTSAALCQGITGPWLSMITVIFDSQGLTQDEADTLGMWTVVCSCVVGVTVSRISDIFQGHLKISLLTLITSSAAMFMWILLLTTHTVSFHKDQLYTAVTLGVSFSWATSALFYELAAEIAYPVPEGVVSGYMATFANVSATLSLHIYFIPGIGIMWMNYCLLLSSLGSVFAMIMVEEQYNRSTIDKSA